MKKRFNRRKKTYFKPIILILLFISSFYFSINIMIQNSSNKMNNEAFLQYIFNSSVNQFLMEDPLKKLNSPSFILNYAFNNSWENAAAIDNSPLNNLGEYMSDPLPQEISDPVVYIYNTHQTEGYVFNKNNEYNLVPTVQMVSYILREKLNNVNIRTIVETNDITEILRTNNWSYKYSYDASRLLIQNTLSKYPSIKYMIDIHRDSSPYEKTTTTIDDTKFAKVLLVVGKEHENYESNLALATKFNQELIKINQDLSRGITVKEGAMVNGIYNQDLMSNAILLEMGGQYNTIDEVNNTIPLIVDVLYKIINETTSKEE